MSLIRIQVDCAIDHLPGVAFRLCIGRKGIRSVLEEHTAELARRCHHRPAPAFRVF